MHSGDPFVIEDAKDLVSHGWVFSRSSQTGVKRLSAELYLDNGEQAFPLVALRTSAPGAVEHFQAQADLMEQELRDAVQFSFEILQGRMVLGAPQRLLASPAATIRIAVNLVQEGLISEEEALSRVSPDNLTALQASHFPTGAARSAKRKGCELAIGHGFGRGVACGQVALDYDDVMRLRGEGQSVILLCEELGYSHREALTLVDGLVLGGGSILGARTPGVVVEDLVFGPQYVHICGHRVEAGMTIALDASTGEIFNTSMEIVGGRLTAVALTLLGWADRVRGIDIRANVGSPEDVQLAQALGAQGVGLLRIESLFQQTERLPLFQAVLKDICEDGLENSDSVEQLAKELEEDVYSLLMMASPKVESAFVIRLLDAPLSVMLRHWKSSGELSPSYFSGKLGEWMQELNPVHGLRCGRLSLLYPALLHLQVLAILRASKRMLEADGALRLQIMMPGACDPEEILILKRMSERVAAEIEGKVPEIGSMLELPRACLLADKFAAETDFLSFGTGDLTESTCGISRYDSRLSFLPGFLDQNILAKDPYSSLDQEGVGALMKLAVERVKAKYPSFEMGICGAQAVDPESLDFCSQLGLDYVSVPVENLCAARLAAAQAALRS